LFHYQLVVNVLTLTAVVSPVNSSVAADSESSFPPKPKADVCVPPPANKSLAVLIDVVFVQDVPSYCSVTAVSLGSSLPPKANAAVCVPAPPKVALAVFKSATSVQLDPFQDSLTATFVVVYPP